MVGTIITLPNLCIHKLVEVPTVPIASLLQNEINFYYLSYSVVTLAGCRQAEETVVQYHGGTIYCVAGSMLI